MASVTTVRLLVRRAAGRVAESEEKYAPYPQPRWQTLRNWHGPRPSAMCSGVGSVRCAQRPIVTRRVG
jgi:hypothetical protein